MTVRIVFETHSTTQDNEVGIATGWLPGRLSALGREQAAELGRRRTDDGIGAVFSSDLARATETATIAFAGSGIPVCWTGGFASATTARLTARRPSRCTRIGSNMSTGPIRAARAGDRPQPALIASWLTLGRVGPASECL